MKVMTILGTRPEIVRLSRVIPLLDNHCEHRLIHTGQNFEPLLSKIFFQELGIREPDEHFNMKESSFGGQVGHILIKVQQALEKHKPDRVLILGDTNTGLASIMVRKMGIPLYHMEAGNRCYDFKVPEEVNRRIVDNMTTVHMPYNEHSRRNLLREGFHPKDIFVTGNPIAEVLANRDREIDRSLILSQLKVRDKQYFLVTMHRQENVTVEAKLKSFFEGFAMVYADYAMPIVVAIHPRTRDNMIRFGITEADCKGFKFIDPLGLDDFVRLERDAYCVLTDSGTCQEECCLMHTPCVTLRNTTERPETIDAGANILASHKPESILKGIDTMAMTAKDWSVPAEYCRENVAETVVKIVLGHRQSTLD